MHPDLPPPVSTSGVVGWVRRNLLSSPLNIVMTAGAIWFLWVTVPSLIEWLFVNAVWDAENRIDCWKQMTFPGDPDYLSKELPRGWVQPGGCWAFIESRIKSGEGLRQGPGRVRPLRRARGAVHV